MVRVNSHYLNLLEGNSDMANLIVLVWLGWMKWQIATVNTAMMPHPRREYKWQTGSVFFFVENLYKNNLKMFAHTWIHTFKMSLFILKSLQNKNKYVQIVINCILYTHNMTWHVLVCLMNQHSKYLSWIVTLIIKLTCHFSWCSRYSDSPYKAT